MATSPAAIARLTAVGSLTAASVSALLSVTGPWQPASVMLGMLVVVVMSYALVAGSSAALGVAAALEVGRLGVQAISGNLRPGPVVAVVLLVGMVELAGLSFEARAIPVDLWPALARAGGKAIAAGAAAAATTWLGRFPSPEGPLVPVVGVAAAMVLAAVLLGVNRRESS